MLKTNAPICCYLLVGMLATLTACGEVITPQPTAEPSRVGTMPPTPTSTLHPTATALFVPPADTATPTAAPTPIVHVVQPGETLLGIALDYGVTVEALQAANGIEDPRLLREGQELIIPTGEEGGDAAPGLLLPTPTPLPLDVQGMAFYETPVSSLECLGEIVNTTEITITNVQVRVTLFDAVGERLAEADVFAFADIVPPEGRSPFRVLFTSPPPAWASSQVTVIRGEAIGELAAAYAPIAVTEVVGQPTAPQFQVSGVVRNSSADQDASTVIVVVTAYDAQGLVTAARQGEVEIEGPLAPGDTASFSLLFDVHGDTPADFNVIALGRVSTE